MDVTTELPGSTESNLMSNDSSIEFSNPKVHWWGLVCVIIFYLVILFVGIFASWKNQKKQDCEEVMLAGRSIGLFIGIFTMTATWVGGGFINGTAEFIYTPGYGLVWTQAAPGYSLSLLLGGVMFAKKLRAAGYTTMLDPFQKRYGRLVTVFMYVAPLMGDIFWSAAILSALGGSLRVILGMDKTTSIIVSAIIAVSYTVIGGLYSVAFTDVLQLSCLFVGMWLGVGFAFTHDAVSSISETFTTDRETGWIGQIYYEENGPNQAYWIGYYIDSYLLITLGGIPWQAYLQRVLSAKNANIARILCIVACFGCMLMALPAVLLGAIGKSTDWTKTEYAKYSPLDGTHLIPEDYNIVLPLVLQYLCPSFVAVIGLGSISAAVMSSTDSSILSASTMFARNIYMPLREMGGRKTPTEKEIIWVMRVAILFVGVGATGLAIVVNSVYALWVLCSDLVYVILFPQFVLVIHTQFTNAYGSLVGFIVACFLRFLGGEPELGFHAILKFPWYDEETGYQLFPYKTMIAIITTIIIALVSILATYLFKNEKVPLTWDLLNVFNENNNEIMETTHKPLNTEKESEEIMEKKDKKKLDIPLSERNGTECEPMI